MTQSQPQFTLAQMRKVFARHRGSVSQLARDLDRSKVSISQCLHGRMKSKPMLEAIRNRTVQLLAAEARERAA